MMDPVINEKVLSIPPYISVVWNEVKSLRIVTDNKGTQELLISLKDGENVRIPAPEKELVFKAFQFHAKQAEEKPAQSLKDLPKSLFTGFQDKGLLSGGNSATGIKIGAGYLDNINAALSHNPEQKDMPDLPPDLLRRVSAVAKMLSEEDPLPNPEFEEGCNCIHCQIARAVTQGIDSNEDHIEEEVTEEDLRFKEWDIKQKDEYLYKVCNPLNEDEVYSVYLGDPIGCTCGEKNCEHIKAVLSS